MILIIFQVSLVRRYLLKALFSCLLFGFLLYLFLPTLFISSYETDTEGKHNIISSHYLVSETSDIEFFDDINPSTVSSFTQVHKKVININDFINGGSLLSSIPRIIHQVWDTDRIPRQVLPWMETWSAMNPKWEHWLWSLNDVRQLLASQFPELLVLFDSYPHNVFRADVMRYVVLYVFGGVYADLDSVCLRSFEELATGEDCMVSEETYEHVFVVHDQLKSTLVNGILICRPRHPFYKQLIDALPTYAGYYFGDVMYATGPIFLDKEFQKYTLKHKNDLNDNVAVLHPDLLLPVYDNSLDAIVSGKCKPSQLSKLSHRGQEVCKLLWARDFRNVPRQFSFSMDNWFHFSAYNNEWKVSTSILAKEAIPSLKDMKAVLRWL